LSIIEVKELTKRYNSIMALNKISFEVKKGEFFAFLGPNGAGKTTAINILCTLLKPTGGKAYLNGFDCVKEPDKVRKSIGIVFQDPTLDNELTAYENLKFHCYLYNMDKSVMNKRIEEILKIIELYERRNEFVKNFSTGMRRRLEVARGLLHYPRVLFLDEPTIGLDPKTRDNIWDFINRLRKREEITVFLTTHYMEEAENCDRVGVIDRGKIMALDTPSNLKKSIGNDLVYIKTSDNKKAEEEIKKRFNIEIKNDKDYIILKVNEGDNFISDLFNNLSTKIESINIKKTTLNDVFIHLTGRNIEEDIKGEEEIKSIARRDLLR
jgi:ABC-2 type transport system ATP-binding protein